MKERQGQEMLREVLWQFARSGMSAENISKIFTAELVRIPNGKAEAVRLRLIQNERARYCESANPNSKRDADVSNPRLP